MVFCLLCSLWSSTISSPQIPPGIKTIRIAGEREILAGDVAPRGDFLAFITAGKNGHTLFILNLKTGLIQKIEGIRKRARACRWDGNDTLWFEKEDSKGNFTVWCWKDDVAKASPLPIGAWRPVPSPDGKYVAFLSGIQGGLSILDASTKRIQKIPANYVSTYGFTPEGKFFVFIRMSSDQSMKNLPLGIPIPQNQGEVAIIRVPNWGKVKVIDKGALLRPIRISFLKNADFVFLKKEISSLSSPPPLPKTPQEAKTGELAGSKFILYERARQWQAKVIWKEKYVNDMFAVSSDGKFLLVPCLLSQGNPNQVVLKLVNLSTKQERNVGEVADLKDLFFNEARKSFVVISSQKIFYLTLDGKRIDIITR